jgi:hypothetical protein
MTPWILLFCVVSGVVGTAAWWKGRDDHEARRWKDGGKAVPSTAFNNLLHGQTDPGPIPLKPVDWGKPHVAVYSVPGPRPPREHPTLRDLADSGQTHAIDFLLKNPKSAAKSWAELQSTLTGASDADAEGHDPFRFDRVLVATVAKGANWDPGDRMVWTRVLVQPINFAFAGYKVAETENETLKVTSVEATKTRKFSANLGLTIPGLEGPKADLGPSSEHAIKTTADVNAQYEKLGIDILPQFLRIVRESETGGDVVGNTKLSLSVVTDPATIRKTHPKDQAKEVPVDNVVLLVKSTHLEDGASELDLTNGASIKVSPLAALPHCPLLARVWMLYEQRHIDSGREYYDESQQTVSLFRDVDEQKDVEIVSADDVSPAVWSIQILASGENRQHQLHARVANGGWRDLVFTDYSQASNFAHWLRTTRAAKLPPLEFDYENGASLSPFKNTVDECGSGNNSDKSKGVYQPMQGSVTPLINGPSEL